MKKLLLIIASTLLIYSCLFIPDQNESKLQGYWTGPEYHDSLITYQRVDTLVSLNYGFGFLSHGVFKENKNSGPCGTPPISYAQYEGEWSIKDSIITINVPYWGGTTTYKWKLIAVTSRHFSIRRIVN